LLLKDLRRCGRAGLDVSTYVSTTYDKNNFSTSLPVDTADIECRIGAHTEKSYESRKR